MLVNDPPLRRPGPIRLDPKVFGSKAMTYGRWTYKYEIGAEKHAAGVLLIHETGPAGYPFDVVQSKVSEQFDLVTPDKNMGRVAIEGWITLDQGRKLAELAGKDFEDLKRQAVSRDFQPIPLGVTASMTIKNKLRTIDSQNVIARIDGRDPVLRNEYVIYTAHWDHLGVGAAVDGDAVYNGRRQRRRNCRFGSPARSKWRSRPRSVVFLSVTAGTGLPAPALFAPRLPPRRRSPTSSWTG